jgi:hypothetical protein
MLCCRPQNATHESNAKFIVPHPLIDEDALLNLLDPAFNADTEAAGAVSENAALE